MSENRQSAAAGTRRRQKIAAFAAAGIVLVAGATVSSFAAWTDTEWVYGGADTQPNVSTGIFEVTQNVTALATEASWTSQPDAPGGQIDFGVDATAMVPEEPVYGFVRLRTIAESLPGELTLSGASMAAGGDAGLFAALRYRAAIVASPADCTSAGLAAPAAEQLVPAASTLATGSAVDAFALAGGTATDPGAEKTVCFELVLPSPADDALQGDSVRALWNFTALSVTP